MHPSGEQAIARARISWANVNFISLFPMRVRSCATADRGAHLPSHPAHRTSLRLRRPSPPPSPRPSIATAVEASVHRRRAPPPPSPASPPATQPDSALVPPASTFGPPPPPPPPLQPGPRFPPPTLRRRSTATLTTASIATIMIAAGRSTPLYRPCRQFLHRHRHLRLNLRPP